MLDRDSSQNSASSAQNAQNPANFAKRAPTPTECRCLAAGNRAAEWAAEEKLDGDDLRMAIIRAVIRELRDPPHAILDVGRVYTRAASGEAMLGWNAMIDAMSPPVSRETLTGG